MKEFKKNSPDVKNPQEKKKKDKKTEKIDFKPIPIASADNSFPTTKSSKKNFLLRPSTSAKRDRLSLKIEETTILNSVQSTPKSPAEKSPIVDEKKADSKSHQKKGHRKVGRDGTIFYKKTPTSQLIQSIQLGIASLIGRSDRNEEHDLLMKDFTVVKTLMFPRTGSSTTPSHGFADFRFRAFAPVAFRFFRVVFYITTDSFLSSICGETLKELSNPGASGSIFYKTPDDNFLLKTVQHGEAEFLTNLLPGYYMNVSQNNNTMLPKFYGLYSYENLGRSIRLVVMNNALPSNIPIQEKYDLKGSTYKRMASKHEKKKDSPTLKDLDFIAAHKNGFYLSPQHHENFMTQLHRDTMVLESFKIMDYSLLLGIHYLETNGKGQHKPEILPGVPTVKSGFELVRSGISSLPLSRKASSGSLHGVPAMTADGREVVLYVALIDILQRYKIGKKMEHAFKSIVTDGDMVSVHSPKFYRKRFLNFMEKYFLTSENSSGIGKSVSTTYGSEVNKTSASHSKIRRLKLSSDYPTSESSVVNTETKDVHKFVSLDSVDHFYDFTPLESTDL